MRILYLHQYFSVPSASGGTRSYDLAKQFSSEGHKVIVVTSSSFLQGLHNFQKGWTIVDLEELELHVLQLEYSNKLSFTKRIFAFLKFLLYASLRVLKIKADVVLATSTPITIAIPAIIKRVLHKTPYIFEVRDVWPEVPIAMGILRNKLIIWFLLYFERFIYKHAIHIVALSNDMSDSIERRVNVDKNKISVIPNLAEVNRFAQYRSDRSMLSELLGFHPEKVVLYAGTLGMVNGLRYVVELARYSLHIDSTIKYVIVGDGMEKNKLVQYADEKGVLNKNIYFLNPVPKSELPQLYYECTVASSFVIPMPELWANSANKFFDCLAAGKPIVINHQGWQANVIENNQIGFVFDYNIDLIEREARRFCEYLHNDALLQEQGHNAFSLAYNRYSLEIASRNYLKVLANVVQSLPKVYN